MILEPTVKSSEVLDAIASHAYLSYARALMALEHEDRTIYSRVLRLSLESQCLYVALGLSLSEITGEKSLFILSKEKSQLISSLYHDRLCEYVIGLPAAIELSKVASARINEHILRPHKTDLQGKDLLADCKTCKGT